MFSSLPALSCKLVALCFRKILFVPGVTDISARRIHRDFANHVPDRNVHAITAPLHRHKSGIIFFFSPRFLIVCSRTYAREIENTLSVAWKAAARLRGFLSFSKMCVCVFFSHFFRPSDTIVTRVSIYNEGKRSPVEEFLRRATTPSSHSKLDTQCISLSFSFFLARRNTRTRKQSSSQAVVRPRGSLCKFYPPAFALFTTLGEANLFVPKKIKIKYKKSSLSWYSGDSVRAGLLYVQYHLDYLDFLIRLETRSE